MAGKCVCEPEDNPTPVNIPALKIERYLQLTNLDFSGGN